MKKPEWLTKVHSLFKNNISNTFMLSGNIGDYVCGSIYLRDYLIESLRKEFNKQEIYIFDISNLGSSVIERKNGIPFEDILKKMQTPNEDSAFIFTYPEYIIPAGDYSQPEDKQRIVALHNIINSSSFIQSKNIAFFITESLVNIHPMFLGSNSKANVFDIELPSFYTRLDFITEWIKDNNAKEIKFAGTDIKTMANLTAGLQLVFIEDILLNAYGRAAITNKTIMNKKREIIQKEFGEVVEIFDTDGYSLKNFAGQDIIKSYFKETVIDAIRENDLEIVPKGAMLMGPPGTGKTYFAKCLAGDAGINFVEFKMSKILGKYVGESEKAMEKALSVFRALAPVGVFMDEIDQSMSRGEGGSDGSSSVNSNIFGMLLSEMAKAENRGKIVWIAATNYPNNVDEALKRSGRFDKKIPFFAPKKEDRKYVFELHLNNRDLKPADDVDSSLLAEKTEGYTQAEIEEVVVKALELSKRAKVKEINMESLLKALDYMSSNQNAKIIEMEDIALLECNDKEFIPEKYMERQRNLISSPNVNNSFSSVNRANNRR